MSRLPGTCLYRYSWLLLALTLIHTSLHGQVQKKELSANVVKEKIVLDGALSEPAWQNAEKAGGFIQYAPYPGQASTQRTEVSILYDNEAVYIGAMLYDEHPDSILKQLSPRDVYDNNNDAFGVFFDTYSDNQNGFVFIVTAAGVQADGKQKFDNTDLSWNAAWFSKVAFNKNGWCVEMRIPYSAIRFSKSDVQKWGLNFTRIIRRCREESYWNPIVPGQANFAGQSGALTGIHDIESPVRLQLLPYISGYVENYAGNNANTVDGGLDIKYGINDAFTLDTFQPGFYDGELRRVEHYGDTCNIRFCLQQVHKSGHGLHTVKQRIIHVYIKYLRTVLHLLAGYGQCFFILVLPYKAREFLRAGNISALTNIQKITFRPHYQRLQTTKP